jgi:hypothetical protein
MYNGYDIAAIGHDGVDNCGRPERKHGPQYPDPLPALTPYSVPSSIMDLISSSVTIYFRCVDIAAGRR